MLSASQQDLEVFLTQVYRAIAGAAPLKDKVSLGPLHSEVTQDISRVRWLKQLALCNTASAFELLCHMHGETLVAQCLCFAMASLLHFTEQHGFRGHVTVVAGQRACIL